MRRSRQIAAVSARGAAVITAALGVLVAPGTARAQHEIAVSAAGSCPDRAEVAAAVVQAVPDATIVDTPFGVTGVYRISVVSVSDYGASFLATVDGVARSFDDAAADCSDRARKVAVVVALAIEPPIVAAPGVVVAAPGRPWLHASVLPGTHLSIEVAYGISRGDGTFDTMFPLGVSGRMAIERGAWGISLGATWASEEVYAPTRAQRIPIDLSLRYRRAIGPIFGLLELGPNLAWYHVTSQNFFLSESDVYEVGGRVAWRLEWDSPWRVGVYAGVAAALAFLGAHTDASSIFTYGEPDIDVRYPKPWLEALVGLTARVF